MYSWCADSGTFMEPVSFSKELWELGTLPLLSPLTIITTDLYFLVPFSHKSKTYIFLRCYEDRNFNKQIYSELVNNSCKSLRFIFNVFTQRIII